MPSPAWAQDSLSQRFLAVQLLNHWDGVQIARHPHITGDDPAGDAIVVGLADLGDRFRLVANEIEVVEPEHPLPKLPVACAVWRPKPDLRTSSESWLAAGGPHHTVLSTAIGIEELEDFAQMTRTELVVIDAATTPRSFARELRWSQAYYRLAQGLP